MHCLRQCAYHCNSAAFFFLITQTAHPPRITTQPKGLQDLVPGQTVTLTVHATGTEPLMYQWRWKPDGDEQMESQEWQLCEN